MKPLGCAPFALFLLAVALFYAVSNSMGSNTSPGQQFADNVETIGNVIIGFIQLWSDK